MCVYTRGEGERGRVREIEKGRGGERARDTEVSHDVRYNLPNTSEYRKLD